VESAHTVRSVLRTVAVVVAVVVTLYLVYLLRRPIGWVLIAGFLAVALSGPVNWLSARMPRGPAIAAVFLAMLLAPLTLAAVVLPPLVSEADDLVRDLPRYAAEAGDFVERNETLRGLEEDYDVTGRLQSEAEQLPERIGDAAQILSDVGVGLVNSVFAFVTILVLTIFLLGSGRRWVDDAIALMPPDRAVRATRMRERMGQAVGGYVAGAFAIAGIAGVLSFVVLSVLGVPFAAPLAVVAGAFSLIPVIGATIAAVLIAVVTLFANFPTATIVWVIWSIVYQQFENYVIQPQIQKRTVNVQPFVVLVAVLFGATLLGVLGALVAIPVAASIQVAIREYWAWRVEQRDVQLDDDAGDDDGPPGPAPEHDPAPAPA
jgi:predicted PurR-regulated permease PerM